MLPSRAESPDKETKLSQRGNVVESQRMSAVPETFPILFLLSTKCEGNQSFFFYIN